MTLSAHASASTPVTHVCISVRSVYAACQSEDSDFDVDEGQTYAELWMGTHPNGPSRVMRDGHEGTDELQG